MSKVGTRIMSMATRFKERRTQNMGETDLRIGDLAMQLHEERAHDMGLWILSE